MNNLMSKWSIPILFGSVTLSICIVQTCSGSVVVNGGFETGDLSGWSSIGAVTIEDASLGFTPQEGTRYGLIQSHEPLSTSASVSNLESFFGLTLGTIQGLSSEPVLQGSGLAQTVSVSAGDILTFSFNFATNNDVIPDDLFNDFSFFSAAPSVTKIADTFSSFGPSPSPFFAVATGFQSISYTFPTSGDFTIGFGVVDVGDQFFNSAIVLDSVSISTVVGPAVPEPSSMAVFAIGGLMITLTRSCRRRDTL